MKKGFAPILILGLILALSVGGFVTYKLYINPTTKTNTNDIVYPDQDSLNEIVASPTPQTPDETANWKTFANSNMSFKLPTDWLTQDCADDGVYIAPSKDLLTSCNSHGDNIMLIFLSSNEVHSVDKTRQNLSVNKLEEENVVVGGIAGIKLSGVSKYKDEYFDLTGTKMVYYLLEKGGQTLQIKYIQAPNGQDYSADFERIVSTFKFTE